MTGRPTLPTPPGAVDRDDTLGGLLAQELGFHPLGRQVLALLAEGQTAPGDLAQLAQVIARMDRSAPEPLGRADALLVVLLSRMLDRLARQETQMIEGGAPAPPRNPEP